MGHDADRTGAEPLTASVVVPNLDNAQFLEQTLASLERQEVPDLDVVIIDGGSTDGSVDIIETWADRHGARWISEPDEGQAQAINKGFRMVRGGIVTWLNSDDLFPPGAVARAIQEFARDPSLDFIWGFCLYIDSTGRPLRIGNPFVRPDLSQLRGRTNFVTQPGSWFRTRVFDRFGFLDESYQHALDYEYFLRLADGASSRFVPEIMAHFPTGAGSRPRSRSTYCATGSSLLPSGGSPVRSETSCGG
jgi:glycosyltransferase involved in cell wall biosynthesis